MRLRREVLEAETAPPIWPAVFLLSLWAVQGSACAQWRPRDTAMASAFVLEEVVDLVQTQAITRDCAEGNPVLGRCGENLSVDLYFPVVVGANLLIGALLEGWWRTGFQGASIAVQAQVLAANWRAGYAPWPTGEVR